MPDKAAIDMLQPRAVPAISADGSKPDAAFLQPVEQTEPEVKPGETKQETKVEVEAKEPDKTAKSAETTEKSDEELPAWAKREITKARNRQREAEERDRQSQARLDKALAALEKAGKEPTATQTGENDPRPKRTAYNDPDAYETDLDAWHGRQTQRVVRAEMEAGETKRKTDEAKQRETDYVTKLQKTWGDARTAFIKDNPDYEEVAEAEDVQISTPLAVAMLHAGEDGPKLAYWLAKNPEERERLNALQTPAYELGRIADRLNAQPVRTERRAADPISTIRTGRGAATRDRNDPKNYDMEARLKELRANNKPFMPPVNGRPN